MRGSFASLPSLQCSSKHCHTRSLPTPDFLFFVSLYKQQTGYLVNPGHLDIYSGAPGDNALCLSPTAKCVDQCSSPVHFPLPWHTGAPAAECDRYCDTRGQTLNQIVTHSIKYKIKLITKALQLSGGCTALQMCTVCGIKGTLQCQEFWDSRRKIIQFPCGGCLSLGRSD